jgi:cytochrome c biogenesis protein ResB
MTIAIALFTVLSAAAIYGTVVTVVRDGYRRIPTHSA